MKRIFTNLSSYFLILCVLMSMTACEQHTNKLSINNLIGKWQANITLSGTQSLPFHFDIEQKNGKTLLYLINGEERIEVEDITIQQDSVYMGMHIFNTVIRAKFSDGALEGKWIKSDYEDYALPFSATIISKPDNTGQPSNTNIDITGKWEVEFDGENGEKEPAIGVFTQQGSEVSGTFLTPTGDYRYLSGSIDNDKLQLSCFDGEHAFLFTAIANNNNTLTEGGFWSGKSWYQGWSAVKNPEASLPNPNELTYLKEGYDHITFSFPNLNGETVSLSDSKYKGKVVLVQLMGTWCPNCMDETAFLAPYYEAHKNQGLEIIGLAFERDPSLEKATPRLQKLIDRFNIQYDLLIAGSNSKEEAGQKLPMLNHVMSFPTTIFIDRQGRVRKIHTGFSGPGTGVYYENFVEEFEQLMEKLLSEDA